MATPKKLNEMNELWDMGRFPTKIYVGATANILGTIVLTYNIHKRWPRTPALLLWVLTIVPLNVAPVVYLRSGMDESTLYPLIEEMSFRGDQHKFSSWVYAIASGNMMFWIVLAWATFSWRRGPGTLRGVLGLAFICTFFPAWRRLVVPSPTAAR